MSTLLRIFLIVASLAFLLYVLLMVRRDKYMLNYSIVWVALGILGVLAALFPSGVSWLAVACGFATPVNFVYLVVILFLLVASLVFVAALTKQATLIKKLIQEISILESKLDGELQDCGGKPNSEKEHVDAV